ncbi:ROK family protein [Oceanobacillus halotolerans]|uniref:ROK family protein n=1 Tax=Oceanobacillus halotolerans TaxID=2663380 RepID=UPI0013DA4AB2
MESIRKHQETILTNGHKIIGIGIGVPGLVDSDAGIVFEAVNIGWKDVPLANINFNLFYLPAFVLR